MEPLSAALLGAIAAAASAVAGGVAEAAGDDVWAAAKKKLSGWANLEERKQQEAFARAVAAAITRMRREWPNASQVDQALAVLTESGPEASEFVQAAVEQLLLSANPDLGYLLDVYRRQVRFVAALRAEPLPDWNTVEPVLTVFLGEALPAALRSRHALRPLLLEQAQLQAVDVARSTYAAIREQTAVLERFAALLADMQHQPHIQATITAAPGSTISNAPVNVLLNDYVSLPATTQTSLQKLFEHYREYLRATYELLDFRGILQTQNVLRLPLEALYVPLRGSTIAPQQRRKLDRSNKPEAINQQSIIPSEEAGSVPLHALIQNTPRLVILGDPGTGKSTLMKYIMLTVLRNQGRERLGLTSAWLPILFPIAEFAKACEQTRNLAPLDFLRIFYSGVSQHDIHVLFERALLSGRAMVLFDGLDEVRDVDDRKSMVSRIEAFVRRWDLPGNRFLATSRIAGYTLAPLDSTMFAQTEVQMLDDDEIDLFTTKWSEVYERVGWDKDVNQAELERLAQEHKRALLYAIRANESAAQLARNPFLLTMLALIRANGSTLPNRRVELYELCIHTLAETWSRFRSLSGRPIDVYLKQTRQKLDKGFVISLLGPTALWVHAERPGGLVEQRELEHQLEKVFRESYGKSKGEAADLARDFLQLVEEQTGLLQARGKNLYGFLHLTLEEYLAAQALLDQRETEPGLLKDYAVAAGWREVVRLCVASVQSPRGKQRALEDVLDTPTSPETRGIPAIRAGECLLDIELNRTTPQAQTKVIQALLAAITDSSVPIATRVEAGHTLGRLGDPRLLDPATGEAPGIEQYAAVEPYWCPVEHGPFWFGDEQIDRPAPGTRAENDPPPQPPRFDSARLTQVVLPHNITIGRYPVTNAEFARFLEANGPAGYEPARPWWTDAGRKFLFDDREEFIRWPRYWEDTSYNGLSQPVIGVSWYEAAAYCRWLTAEGHACGWLPKDHIIRLPTSLEWERAARHTDTRPFPWGDTTPTPHHANYADAGVGVPAPVGCFRLGRAVCGADDLIGNTFEWLASSNGAGADPMPQEDFTPESEIELSYTYYGDDIEQLCCGARIGDFPYYRGYDWSFRVVQSRALI